MNIQLDARSQMFYKGVAVGADVAERLHDEWKGQPKTVRRMVFWFLVGVEAGESGISTADDATPFMQGAALRAP